MKKNNHKKTGLAISILITIFTLPYICAAETFDISYSLTEGGYRLELDAANPYKGVKIEVNSDISTRYEVVQRVLKPLENRDDPTMVIRDNFVVRGLRGTNRYGTFYIPATDVAVRSDEILYTSDTAGDADSFTLVYGITNLGEIKPGYYSGRLSFTLRPIASSRSEVTKYLDVYVIISKEAEIKPAIEITTATGSKVVSLNSKREEAHSADVLVKVNGTFKKQFTLSQLLPKPLESTEGNRLDYEAVNFVVSDAKKGMPCNQLTALSAQAQNIYISGPNGEADESFAITYSLGELSKQKAGRYSSNIQYFLDEMGKQTRLATLELDIDNERVFELAVTPEEQKSALEFRNLKPKEPPKKNELTIEIKTNLGRRYQVSQKIYSELTNKEGKTISSEYFTLRTESLDTLGALKFPQKTSVQKSEMVLFVSDDKGSADKFKVVYELSIPQDIEAGDYSTRIIYSLLEI